MASINTEVDLLSAIEKLNDHTQLLWQSIDELRSDIQWAVQNGRVVLDVVGEWPTAEDSLSVPVDLATVTNDLDAIAKRFVIVHEEVKATIEQQQNQQSLADLQKARTVSQRNLF